MKRRRRPWGILWGVVVAAVVLELGTRWLIPWENYFAHQGRSIRLSEHLPSQDRVFLRPPAMGGGRVRVRTDADGFLLPDTRDLARPVDLTMLFLGGSTTESLWVQEEFRWPYLAGRQVAQQLGLNVRVLNAGMSGTNAHHSLNVFVNKAVKYHPDLVLVMHVVNDCALLMTRGNYEDWTVQSWWGDQERGGLARLGYELLTAHSHALGLLRHLYAMQAISRGQARRPENINAVDVASPTEVPVDAAAYETRLRMLVGVVRAAGATPMLLTEPVRPDGEAPAFAGVPRTAMASARQCTAAFNERVRKLAREERIALIDLAHKVTDPSWFSDSMHYTDEGSRLVGDLVSQAVCRDALAQPSGAALRVNDRGIPAAR